MDKPRRRDRLRAVLPFVFVDGSAIAPLQPWGLLFVLGWFVWDFVARRRAVRVGIDVKDYMACMYWVGIFTADDHTGMSYPSVPNRWWASRAWCVPKRSSSWVPTVGEGTNDPS